MLIVAGFQVPIIPLFEVVGKVGAVLFSQNAGIAVKLGVIVFTLMFTVAVVAH